MKGSSLFVVNAREELDNGIFHCVVDREGKTEETGDAYLGK